MISNRIIRLIIADDHELMREGILKILSECPRIQVIGQAENGEELVALTTQLRPDVVISDIKMPKMDGIEAAHQIIRATPGIGIIGLTAFEDEGLMIKMLEAGAQGYMFKTADKSEIIEAIFAVASGKTYYCSRTNKQIALFLTANHSKQKNEYAARSFSEKELTIIRFICQQFSNKEIAHHLGLSIRTVETHRERILEKMDIKNTAGIVVYSIRNGIYKL